MFAADAVQYPQHRAFAYRAVSPRSPRFRHTGPAYGTSTAQQRQHLDRCSLTFKQVHAKTLKSSDNFCGTFRTIHTFSGSQPNGWLLESQSRLQTHTSGSPCKHVAPVLYTLNSQRLTGPQRHWSRTLTGRYAISLSRWTW